LIVLWRRVTDDNTRKGGCHPHSSASRRVSRFPDFSQEPRPRTAQMPRAAVSGLAQTAYPVLVVCGFRFGILATPHTPGPSPGKERAPSAKIDPPSQSRRFLRSFFSFPSFPSTRPFDIRALSKSPLSPRATFVSPCRPFIRILRLVQRDLIRPLVHSFFY
jgi:hypothetical protein